MTAKPKDENSSGQEEVELGPRSEPRGQTDDDKRTKLNAGAAADAWTPPPYPAR